MRPMGRTTRERRTAPGPGKRRSTDTSFAPFLNDGTALLQPNNSTSHTHTTAPVIYDEKETIPWIDILGNADYLSATLVHMDYLDCARLCLAWKEIGQLAKRLDEKKFSHILFRFATQLELKVRDTRSLYRAYSKQPDAEASHFDLMAAWTPGYRIQQRGKSWMLCGGPTPKCYYESSTDSFNDNGVHKIEIRRNDRGKTLYYDSDGEGYGCNIQRIKKHDSGTVRYYEWDCKVRKVKDGSVTTYEGGEGHEFKLSKQHANGSVLEYGTDGKTVKQIHPDGRVWSQHFDRNGDLVKQVKPDGSVLHYCRGRLCAIVRPFGTGEEAYSADECDMQGVASESSDSE